MAALDRLAPGPVGVQRGALIALALVGWAASGAGLTNGDLAAYLEQAERGSLTERPTHLGYVALARGLSLLPGDLALYLDHLATASALACAAMLPRGAPLLLGVAACLPLVGHGEVDATAHLLVLLAARAPAPWAALAWAAGITVSPFCLLAAPWLAAERGPRWVVPVTLGAVALLSLPEQGGWWWGHRGVLRAPDWRWAWGLDAPLLAALVLYRLQARDAWLVLLALAPPDLPRAVLPVLLLGHRALRPAPSGVTAALLSLSLAAGARQAWDGDRRVRREQAWLVAAADALRAGEGLIAPWSLGARASYLATGRVYGARWRVPGGFVRDQEGRWCAGIPARVIGLPPEHPQVLAALADPDEGCPGR
jgi:hypothetical protein